MSVVHPGELKSFKVSEAGAVPTAVLLILATPHVMLADIVPVVPDGTPVEQFKPYLH